jgi:NlpC/P60 family
VSTYRLPRQYRRRYVRHVRHSGRRYRHGNRWTPGQIAVAVVLGLLALGGAGSITPAGPAAVGVIEQVTGIGAHPGRQAREAVSFARSVLAAHCPYVFGGNGPCSAGYDCSSLVQAAWARAGITIDRTTFDQWGTLHHITPGHERAGDLVFFPGGDGTWASPGHVGMVIRPGVMIDEYDQSVGVREEPYGAAALPGSGMNQVVGFARVVPLVPGSPRAAARSNYTPSSWARAFVAQAGYQPTACNLAFTRAWVTAEGGNWQNKATYNPLNTTRTVPGSTNAVQTQTPGVWVQAYPSWLAGLAATVATLRLPRYAGVRAQLAAGNDAQAAAAAVVTDRWGTAPFNPGSC